MGVVMIAALRSLKEALQEGLIDQEDFVEEKKKILSSNTAAAKLGPVDSKEDHRSSTAGDENPRDRQPEDQRAPSKRARLSDESETADDTDKADDEVLVTGEASDDEPVFIKEQV